MRGDSDLVSDWLKNFGAHFGLGLDPSNVQLPLILAAVAFASAPLILAVPKFGLLRVQTRTARTAAVIFVFVGLAMLGFALAMAGTGTGLPS